MKRSSFILNIKNIIQSIDHQTYVILLELMLDELIFSFNSPNGPFWQVVLRSSFILTILSNWFNSINTKINKKWNQISQLMIKDEMKDNSIFKYLWTKKDGYWYERWLDQPSQNSNISHFFIQSHPIINFSHFEQYQLHHHDQSKSEISQVDHKYTIKKFFWTISKIINWKEIMKFILHHLEDSLLLLLPTKTKQPPIVHLPNLKNGTKSQDEEEFFHTKNIKNIIQSIDHQTHKTWSLELMLDELIFSFNSPNGPSLQVVLRSLLILESAIFYLQILKPFIITSSLILSTSNGENESWEKKSWELKSGISQQKPSQTQPKHTTNNHTLTQQHLKLILITSHLTTNSFIQKTINWWKWSSEKN